MRKQRKQIGGWCREHNSSKPCVKCIKSRAMTDKPKESAEDILIEFVPKLKLSQKDYARLIAAFGSCAQSLLSAKLKEKDEEIKQAYIDGTNACHKAFQPLLKSALKEQREICAKKIKDGYNLDPAPFNKVNMMVEEDILNAPSPPIK